MNIIIRSSSRVCGFVEKNTSTTRYRVSDAPDGYREVIAAENCPQANVGGGGRTAEKPRAPIGG